MAEEDLSKCRRPWHQNEDEHLRQLVELHGIKSWAHIATFLHMRNGKQCRERWRNHLRPQLNKGDWTTDEDIEIWERVKQMGTKWAQISELYMPNRTDNDIKNRWNSIIRKHHHPGGRKWAPEEEEERARIIGSASRTQISRRSTTVGGWGLHVGGEAHEGKRKDSDDPISDGIEECTHTELLDDSPGQGRKLFISPGSSSSKAAVLLASTDGEAVQLHDTPAKDLFGAEDISSCSFGIEPFLGMAGSISQICSPVNEARTSSRLSNTPQQHWFDHDLVNSLSPILTPSFRHATSQPEKLLRE